MKVIVSESQYKYVLGEMAYPSSFNMDEFKSIKSFKGKVDYCKNHLPYIGGGSSRMVFKIDDDKCLKLAKNTKGLAQNENEVDLYEDNYSNKDVLANIYEYDTNNYWLEMQIANKCSPSKFRNYIGVDFNFFCDCIRSVFGGRYSQKATPEMNGFMENSEFFQEVSELIGNFSLPIGDLMRLSSYGVVSGGRVVIVDYGLSEDTYRNHYDKK